MIHRSNQVVSAIVPARNEEHNIARSVSSIAAQPEILEVIVVNDESEDRTEQVLKELESCCPRLNVIRVDELPEGWLGKPHALALGARKATGEWLLFTDADTVHNPGSLGILLGKAEDEHAALLSISPGQKLQSWWEKSVLPLIFTRLAVLYPFEKVSDPKSPIAAANGQYILVRRAMYESVGGHAAARGAILEDVSLAQRVKAAGGRLLFLAGSDWAETHMYRSFAEMWMGWTKNLFQLYGSDEGAIRRTIVDLLGCWFVELTLVTSSALLVSSVFLFPGRWRLLRLFLGVVPLFVLARQHKKYANELHRSGFSTRLANYFFLGAPLLSLLLVSSLRAHRPSGVVKWKGRTYSGGQLQ
jgi:glycosyltransferase involved in cell wall biosynthesis